MLINITKKFFICIIFVFTTINFAYSAGWQGCCSQHNGVAFPYQCVNNKVLCADNTLSTTCSCTKDSNEVLPYDYINKDPIIFPEKTFNRWFTSPFSAKNSNICMITTPSMYNSLQYCFSKTRDNFTNGYLSKNITIYPYTMIDINSSFPLSKYNVSLSYSVDNSRYIDCTIDSIENYSGYSRLNFKAKDISKFTTQCQRGSKITFCINNGGSLIYKSFPLSGFTNGFIYISNILGNY